jgi:hypothetical protein
VNRASKLSKATGKPYPWCREFIKDFGDFSYAVAKAFNLSHKVTDRKIARSVDAIRLREDSENDPNEDDLAKIFHSAARRTH